MSKNIIQSILRIAAKISIRRNNYKIIAITGSAGKTSTRKAISLVLKSKYKVLAAENDGYNTEIGLPLTILEKRVPKNKFQWLIYVLLVPFWAVKKRNYDFCVLEMGADKPGDIEYLTSVAKPNIAVLTTILPVHTLEFKSIENIAKEKSKIFSNLGKEGIAIFNSDIKFFDRRTIDSGVKTLAFGTDEKSDIYLKEQKFDNGITNFSYIAGKEEITIRTECVGQSLGYVFGAAIAVGMSCQIDTNSIANSLEGYRAVPGRLNILKGKNGSIIIDDSYNANPGSMKIALDVLDNYKEKRKIAALGNMNELGDLEEPGHREVGKYCVKKCQLLITVGESAKKYLADEAIKAGMKKESIFNFDNSKEAGQFLARFVKKDDVILVKGSQNNVRMEFLVKEIMADPEKSAKLLVRQGKLWSKK